MIKFVMNPKCWTEGAKFCYRRGCNCNGCYVSEIVESKCIMKRAVLKLVEKFGAPEPESDSPYSPKHQSVLDAILNGANTKKEIAKVVNMAETTVQVLLCKMYEIARTEGFREIDKRNILPEYIMWVRERKIYNSL